MSKTKILLWQIAGCIAFGTVLGVSFWLFDGGKTRKSVSDCPGGVSNAQEMASASESKTVLICHSSPVSPCPRSVKVYQGKSVWDTIKIGEAWRTVEYLEVMK